MSVFDWLLGRRANAPVPLCIVAGPSHSGKTTFIKRLLASAPQGLSLGLISNDAEHHAAGRGQACACDHTHEEHEGEPSAVRRFSWRFKGGCACGCEGDKRHVHRTFASIAKAPCPPDLLILETGGTEDCEALAERLAKERKYVVLDFVCTVISAVSAMFELKKPEVISQVTAADVVLLNEIDHAKPDVLRASREKIISYTAKGTPVFETVRCEVDILPLVLAGARGMWRPEPPAACTRHDVVLSECAEVERLVSAVQGRFLRAKGFVESNGRAAAFNATSKGTRWETVAAPDGDKNVASFYGLVLDVDAIDRAATGPSAAKEM